MVRDPARRRLPAAALAVGLALCALPALAGCGGDGNGNGNGTAGEDNSSTGAATDLLDRLADLEDRLEAAESDRERLQRTVARLEQEAAARDSGDGSAGGDMDSDTTDGAGGDGNGGADGGGDSGGGMADAGDGAGGGAGDGTGDDGAGAGDGNGNGNGEAGTGGSSTVGGDGGGERAEDRPDPLRGLDFGPVTEDAPERRDALRLARARLGRIQRALDADPPVRERIPLVRDLVVLELPDAIETMFPELDHPNRVYAQFVRDLLTEELGGDRGESRAAWETWWQDRGVIRYTRHVTARRYALPAPPR